ncbi:hypothetical protein MNV_1080004 [Candidatus Methanoperedens nitroreducens]|uniref:Uncharacterized protein n=1 Tax=Candidatus Methanoperedens nitratireducens TaxID=1392998 RepID=A0A284VIS9_9EURY|nr:hypothetical protein MNV_1080004 [Candidatus Methanoperedens nitroreducens]
MITHTLNSFENIFVKEVKCRLKINSILNRRAKMHANLFYSAQRKKQGSFRL